MNPNSKEFKKLQDKWYKKLKKDGFDDIENSFEDLRTGSNNNIQQLQTVDSFEARAVYYRLASQFLYEHKFENLFDRQVWSAHCEGIAMRQIAKAMNTYKRKVNDSILRTKLLMLKEYKV